MKNPENRKSVVFGLQSLVCEHCSLFTAHSSRITSHELRSIMKHSMEVGFSFGATSGIITTLGLLVGLNASTHSKGTVIGGILVIALADAFSDALGIHISEESENIHSHKQVWLSTLFTFIAKLVFSMTFILPVFFLDLTRAVWVSLVWGLSVLSVLSYRMAKNQGSSPFKVISEHIFIAIVVVVLTNQIGGWIARTF